MTAGNEALFAVLRRFAETLATRFDVADVLYNLTDSTIEVLDATAAGVSLADGAGALRFVSASSEAAARLEHVQQESQQGPCQRAFTTRQAVVVDDIAAHDEWPSYRRAAVDLGFSAVLGIPLIVGDNALGALNIYNDEARVWATSDMHAAHILADIATSYVLHASRLDDARRLNEQLQLALDSRIVIEQAKGILAGELGIDLDTAFAALRDHARSRRAALRTVAEAVVDLGLRPHPPAK